jgi:threonine dehydrogenase-like Zn-dependent dehydrogenase
MSPYLFLYSGLPFFLYCFLFTDFFLVLTQIDLKFINRYHDTWPAGINALADKRVLDLDDLVTHTFPLPRALEAMECCASRENGCIKVHIVDEMDIPIPSDIYK